ncbi:MAG TPA: DUF1501 domain-containing protein [Rhodanobacteraceae bacterium]|nr:DUF1501 domain-containing protein [Rhodanobacteraceae bacterium]
MHVNRRQFLRKSIGAALGGASLYSAFGSLRLMAATLNTQTAAALGGYKALVCVFLFGGNDSFNSIVPTSGPALTDYLAARGALAQTAGLHALTPQAGGGPGNYALHPGMPELASLFNAGKAAVVANVGSLLYPITAAQYQAGSVASPPQLFSHQDQAMQWQTSRPDDANALGWGGRIADLLHAGNSGQVPMSITLSGNNSFERGAVVTPYGMDPNGVGRMSYHDDGDECWIAGSCSDYGAETQALNRAAYEALIAPGTQTNALERAFASANARSIDIYNQIDSALGDPPLWSTPFPADNDLAAQLQMVARLIGIRNALGMSRQIYFVSTGNYDTHTDQLANQEWNLSQLSQALKAFHDATVQLGVDNDVTTFTASDFGRSLAVNASGTDHGWGGHHFVLGGAVQGGRFYGAMPSLKADNNPDDTGWGQIIPTTAVDQYAATLARWLGVDAGGIGDIFPNLGRFASSDLGFMG